MLLLNCAQRLSASQGATPLSASDCIDSGLCSTPFGITGCYAPSAPRSPWSYPMCSTPFGITGCYAGRPSDACPLQSSTCSTPFGITGCYASSSGCPLKQAEVLNAFRHHRVLRGRRTASPANHQGAQRLSASQGATRITPCGLHVGPRVCRAQRLSASQGATHTTTARSAHLVSRDVLNAFRHHRVLRPITWWPSRSWD